MLSCILPKKENQTVICKKRNDQKGEIKEDEDDNSKPQHSLKKVFAVHAFMLSK